MTADTMAVETRQATGLRALRNAVAGIIAAGIGTGVQASLHTMDGRGLDFAYGWTAEGVELTPRTRFPLACATKAITAALVLEECRRHGIDRETPLARFIPEFGDNGKQDVTIRQLLTNTHGIAEPRSVAEQMVLPVESRFELLCQAGLHSEWDPDVQASYSPGAGFEALGPLVELLTARRFADHYDATLGRSLGSLTFLADFAGTRRQAAIEAAPVTAFSWLADGTHEADTGRGIEADSLVSMIYSGSPAYGAVGCASDLCRLWLLIGGAAHEGNDELIHPSVARAMTSIQCGPRYDRTLRRDVEYGYGVLPRLAPLRPWGFPAELTERSYGHLGLSQVFGGFVPEWGAAFAIVVNGRTAKLLELAALRQVFGGLARFAKES